MSVRVMSLVWECGPDDAAMRLVLLALADIADDDGKCWPSMVRIAQRGCMSERNARRIVRKLEDDGWLRTEQHPGRNKTNTYWLTKPDKALSARTDCPPGQVERQNRTNDAFKPDMAMSAKPSRTINEPSEVKKDADEVRCLIEAWASPEATTSFIAYRRKAKGKALTVTAAKRLATHLRTIFDRGGDTDDALGMAEERGWQTVEADWYFNAKGNGYGNGHRGGNSKPGPHNALIAGFALAAHSKPQ